MTTILALYDTNLANRRLHSEIVKLAGEADLVLHAGNFTSQAAYDALKRACKKDLWAVFGESDPKDSQEKTTLTDSAGKLLPLTWFENYDGINIYLENKPCQPPGYSYDEIYLMRKAESMGVDLMVFGHFDKPIIAWGKKDEEESSHVQLLVCPGSSSTFKDSFPTAVRINASPGEIKSVELISIPAIVYQNGWRRCTKCQGLFYGENAGISHCPEGGQHIGGTKRYSLARDSNAPGQTGWRWCIKCQSLFYGEGIESSKCPNPDNEKHDLTGSLRYTLVGNNPNAPGEEKWKWCSKCQGLFYEPNIENSNCPKGGKHITAEKSANYKLESY